MSKKSPDIVFRKTKLCLKNIDKNRNGELIILVFMEGGVPKFKKAQIRFIENEALIITMRYPRWFGI